MRELSSEEIKRIELDILLELDAICKAHGLRYYLAFGTLIGALRHEGFIPWDDDIDVLIPRADYECLLMHFDEWRSNDRFDIAIYRDGKSTFQYAKMVDTTTKATELFVLEKYEVGLWVDLFPLDECPSHMKAKTDEYRYVGLLRELIVGDPKQGTTAARRAFKQIASPIARRIPVSTVSKWMDSIARCAENDGQSDRYWDVMASGGKQYRSYLKTSLEPARMVPFEGYMFRAPRESELLLEIVFGDWRRIPPEDERPSHMLKAYALDD